MPSPDNQLADSARYAVFAGFHLDLQTLWLYRGAERLALPARAARVLELLLRQAGTLTSRDQIRAQVWGERLVDFEASLNTAIRSIRRALNDDAAKPVFVETVPRLGYRFLPQPQFVDALPGSTRSRRRSARIIAIVTVAVLAIIGLGAALNSEDQNNQASDQLQTYVSSPGYRDFLHGRYALSQGNTELAETRLNAAVASDPELAPAYVSLARANVYNRRHGWSKIVVARRLVDQALELDPQLAAAHVLKAALALYYWRDHDQARRHVDQARTILPAEPDALVIDAYLNIVQGHNDAALAAIGQAHELRPLSSRLNADYGWVLYKAGHWDDAEQLCKTSIELNQASQFALECVVHINHSQGDHAEAAEYGMQLMTLRGAGVAELDRLRAVVDARERERQFWRWTLNWLDDNQTNLADSVSKRAIVLTMLGRYDEAAAAFDRAYQLNGTPFLAFLAVDPRVAELHAHERFPALAALSVTPVTLR